MANLDLDKNKPKLKPLVSKEKEEVKKEEKPSTTTSYTNFISYLMNCSKVARMYAIITKSYATHKAMDHYLCNIWEPIYCLSKQISTEYGDLKGFTDYKLSEYESMEPLKYFDESHSYIEGIRDSLFKDADHTVTSEINKILKITNNARFHLKMK